MTAFAAGDVAVQDYAIGNLTLHPHHALLDAGAPVTIGGRALDLLSVLAAADGAVVSKDELLAKVWRGAIVEDNVLQAQVSAARKALGGEAARLVTVHRHGYLLELNGGVAEQTSPAATTARPEPASVALLPQPAGGAPAAGQRPWTRRAAAGAVVIGAAAAAGLALWPRANRHVPDPRAVELYRRGQLIQNGGVETGDAKALYRQAVAIDPEFADGWSALALAERVLQGASFATPFSDPRLVRSAAERALRLDPGNAHARLALINLYPQFRRWRAQEARLRAFGERYPNVAFGQHFLAWLLFDVGRFEEASVHARRATEIDPQPQRGWWMLGLSLALAGRSTESDIAFAQGLRLWPKSSVLWFGRYETFFANRRHAEAAAFVQDRSRRPRGVPDEVAQRLILAADAFASEESKARIIELSRTSPARGQIDNFPTAALLMTLQGLNDMVFEAAEAYFFGGTFKGERFAPPGPLDPRYCGRLFAPALVPLRDDPRWGALLERTGLEDYWRKSGTQPDFRRT